MGNVLHQPVGRVPARRTGDGRLPSPAWDPAYGSRALIDWLFEQRRGGADGAP